MSHPDLNSFYPLSYDSETGTSPSLIYGKHGTACAGIIGAEPNNSEGIAGIAPNCQLMSISNTLTETINIKQKLADAIEWAWQNGADVISNSWGSSALSSSYIDEAISNALTQGRNGLGCVIVFASGNDNGAVRYPANSNPDIIAVGAMSPCGERKSPSSCDTEDEWGSNYGTTLDLVAPGVLIPTTDLSGDDGYNPYSFIHVDKGGDLISEDYNDHNYTIWFNGTSSACPQVAAVAALILSVNPNLSQNDVQNIIASTCTKIGDYNYTTNNTVYPWHEQVGYGCVNAYEAVKKAIPKITGPDIVCPSGSTYTINNLPYGTNVSWTSSSNISCSSGTGDNPCIFVANGIGSGYIEASLQGSCMSTNTDRKEIFWVGKPSFSLFGDPQPLFPRQRSMVTIDYSITGEPGGQGVYDVNWSYSGPITSLSGNLIKANFTVASYGGDGFIYASATNQCGSKENRFYYEVDDFMRMSTFPNPADEYVEINFIESDELSEYQKESKSMISIPVSENTKSLGKYEVQIWHERKGLVKQLKSTNKKLQIPTKYLEEGSYFLHVIVHGQVFKQQLRIQR